MYLVIEMEVKGLVHKPEFRVETGEVRSILGRHEALRDASGEMCEHAKNHAGRRYSFTERINGVPTGAYSGKYYRVIDETELDRKSLPSWCKRELAKLER
jgi:hypothetical protein